MTQPKITAQMVSRCCGVTVPRHTEGPCWVLYVALMGETQWPTHAWPGNTVPTPQERAAALASLGFTPTLGAEWEWSEDTTPEYHPHPCGVQLFACITVRPSASEEATA